MNVPTGGIDWEQQYVLKDTPWDKGHAHPALEDWLGQRPLAGRVLVPGCGRGHDVRAIAAGGGEVTGLDLSPTAVAEATKLTSPAGERYREGDFFQPPAAWLGGWDWIFEHTCFCAINPALREAYVRQAADLLRPGGHLLAIFFLDPGTDDDGPPYGVTRAELDALFGGAFTLVEEAADIPTYPGREGRELRRLLRRR